ncbi:MAG TPA: PepSY domain-containing protein [Alphaproteobacteria bacterium]|nr:PepSY domain-containing protein [Alphaproteobacteria bacterium]
MKLTGLIAIFLALFLTGCAAEQSAEVSSDTKISEEEAKLIALNAVDLSLVGELIDIELELEAGIEIYVVKFTKDGIETDVKIDAKTGEILKIEDNLADSSDDPKISQEEATQIALDNVDGTVNNVEIAKSQGVVVYEVEIEANGVDNYVSVDVDTGAVVDIQTEES